jgi:hypothetical protein
MSFFGYYGTAPGSPQPNWTARLRAAATAPQAGASPSVPSSQAPSTDVFQYTLNALKQTASPMPTPSVHQASWFQPSAPPQLSANVSALSRAKVVGPEASASGQYQVITDRGTLTFDKSASHTQPFANARVMWSGDQAGEGVPVTMTPAEKKTLYKYMKQCLLNQQTTATPQASGAAQSPS